MRRRAERLQARLDRARRGTGGRRVLLRCGGRPCGPAPLRWAGRRPARSGRQQRAGAVAYRPPPQLRGATSTTRPWVQGLRHVEVVAEYRSNPAALRCSAPQRRSTRRPPAPLRETPWTICKSHRRFCAKAWAGGWRRTSAAPSSAAVRSARAQRALRRLTRRGCLSAVSAANEASSATRPRGEQHRAVGAQRRPPQ